MSTYSQSVQRVVFTQRNRVYGIKEMLFNNSHLQTLRYFVISVFVIAFVCIGSSIIVNADTGASNVKNKYYTSINIEENNTLWDIEARYNSGQENRESYINSIMKLNNMDSDILYNGQNLIVYYYVD